MFSHKLAVVLVLSGVAFTQPLQAQSLNTAAATFLNITPGSRPNAMGSAQTALAEDLFALYYNPAGIADLQRGSAGFFRHNLWGKAGFPLTFVGGVLATKVGVVGVAFNNLNLDSSSPFGDTINSYERAFQLSLARKMGSNVALGGSLKLVRSKLGGFQDGSDFSANAIAVDFGLLVRNVLPHLTWSRRNDSFPQRFREFGRKRFQGLAFGLALLNSGPDGLTFVDNRQKDPLPQRLKLGIAFNAVDTDEVGLLLALDIDKFLVHRSANGEPDGFVKSWFTSWGNGLDDFRLGAEIEIYHVFAFRFGRDASLNFRSDTGTGVHDWTYGFGIVPEWARLNIVRRKFPTGVGIEKWVADFSLTY